MTALTRSEEASNGSFLRDWIALLILLISAVLITALAVLAIVSGDEDTSERIFSMLLPVATSWVGTVLAFYFGRENFEAANKQVRQLIDRLTPEERARALVTAIMRKRNGIVLHKHPAGQSDPNIDVNTLRAKLTGDVSRLPVLGDDDVARYLLHSATIDRYLAEGGQGTDTLAQMIASEKAKNREYGPGKGFIVVAESATIGDAKRLMELTHGCQDIFVTKGGSDKERLTGWISNVRLSKYLQQ